MKYTHNPLRGFPTCAGIRTGLLCTKMDNGRFDTYTCGIANCSLNNNDETYTCTTSVNDKLITGTGKDNMKTIMAGLNEVLVSGLEFPF